MITDKNEWTSKEIFTPAYFKSKYNNLVKNINGIEYTLPEIIDLCIASTPDNKAPYPNIYKISKDFPEYAVEIPEMFYGKSNRIFSRLLPSFFTKQNNEAELFFGGKGCSFPTLHIDLNWVHTQLTQIIGEKEFILYPPDQTPYLYSHPIYSNNSEVNIMEPDYDKFPLFKNAKALKIIVKPGETIFIPSGWWHTTYIHNFNLTYAVDHVNSFNWNAFMYQIYIGTKKFHPNLAWIVNVYKVVFGKLFNFKELLFNKN